MGGRAQTPAEEKQLHTASLEQRKQEFANASLYDRYLNIQEPGSAIGSMAMAMPRSRSQFFATIQRLPVQMADMLSKSFGLGKAFAAPQGTYDYGFPKIGFSIAEQNDSKYDNGFDNEAYMLQGDRLDRMNNEYGKDCFFMTIDHDGNFTHYTPGDPTDRPSKCDNTTDGEFTAYRYYKADLEVGFENACYEGDESSCDQIGMGKLQPPASSTTPNTAGGIPTGDTITLATQIGSSPNITFQTKQDSDYFDKVIATGKQTDCGGPTISPTLLGVILKLSQSYKIVLGVFDDGHGCDSGFHPKGAAVDINGVNPIDGGAGGTGNQIRYTADQLPILKQFYQSAGEVLAGVGGGGLGQQQCFGGPAPKVSSPPNVYFDDSCNHLHMDTRGK
jgi:hypothetical protein